MCLWKGIREVVDKIKQVKCTSAVRRVVSSEDEVRGKLRARWFKMLETTVGPVNSEGSKLAKE